MDILVLTQQGGILKPFAIVLGFIINYIYRFLELFGIDNVGLTIILFTLVVNVLMIPLTIRQLRFTKLSTIMQPELNKIQKKYAGKRDEKSVQKMQAETQAVYDKYGANPVGGCLPLLIQTPIIFALYRVISNVPAYVQPVKDVYMHIAEPIMNATGAGDIMTGLIESMNLNIKSFDITNVNKVIDVLYMVKSTAWDTVKEAFASSSSVVDAINTYAQQIIRMNALPGGLSISDAPVTFGNGIAGIFPGILIPILAGVTQFWNMRVSQGSQKQNKQSNSAMSANMKMMNYMMPFMSVFFCFTLPAGLGLYWVASAFFRTIIYILINKFSHIDAETLIEQNKEKAMKKAEKRRENEAKLESYANMKTSRMSISENAKRSTGSRNTAGGSSSSGNRTSGSGSRSRTKNTGGRTSGVQTAGDITSAQNTAQTAEAGDTSTDANVKAGADTNTRSSSSSGRRNRRSGKKGIVDEEQKGKKSISGYAHMINRRDD